MFMTDDVVFHREAIALDFRDARADRDYIGVSQRDLEPAVRRSQNWSNPGSFHKLQKVQLLEIRYARTLKETKVSRVVEVTERIHLSPRHGCSNHNRAAFKHIVHVSRLKLTEKKGTKAQMWRLCFFVNRRFKFLDSLAQRDENSRQGNFK